MGTIYAICLAVGGILVLSSIFLGGHGDFDADTDASFELDAHVDADIDADVAIDIDADAEADIHSDFDKDLGDLDTGIWLPFLSMRFWIFGSAFFGLTGVVLTLLEKPMGLNSLVLHLTSAGMGLVAGTGSAYLFRALQKQEVNSMIKPRQLVGQTARVSLPVSAGARGKIYLTIGDERIDMIASTDDEEGFQRGDEAFIIQIKEGEARIVKMNELKS